VTGAPRSIVATCLAVVAAVAVVGLLIDRAREARPVIADVAELADRPAGDPAPRPNAEQPGLLDAGVDGLAFPDWSERGWRAVGMRRDEIDGRRAVTVRYRSGRRALTYTIVAGAGHIDYGVPTVTRYRESRHGPKVELNAVSPAGGDTRVLAFKRRSRTVVMTTRDVDDAALRRMERLANWRAGGRLRY
jgi:hypothetical protein